jgi:hypothetical protein
MRRSAMSSSDFHKKIDDVRKTLEETLQDYTASIKAIKGDEYTQAVKFLAGMQHTGKMIAIATKDAPDHVKHALSIQFANTGAIGANLIMHLMKIDSEEEVTEMMKWADNISDSVDEAISNVAKTVRKEMGDDN